MKKNVSILLAAVLLCMLQLPVIRPFAAAVETEQAAVECSAVTVLSKDGVSAGFFKTVITRLLTALKMLCMLIQYKTEQESRDERLITDVLMDKARYMPGEKPVLSVTLCAQKDAQIELTVKATYLTKTVCEGNRSLTLKAGEIVRQSFTLSLPEKDFTAYAVEIYAKEEKQTVDAAMTAAEVASDWYRFPRYGYLTNYTAQTDAQLDATIERLNRFHITGLFFYDVLDRHDWPLAGTANNPAAAWQTLAKQNASFDTVKGLIDRGHSRGMNSYIYNLLFGAYQDYADFGIDAAWGLYKDRNGVEQDYHGELPGSWETQRIYLFDPANVNWQNHYLKAMRDALDVFGYDGIQEDSLGSRGTVYDANGNEVDLAEAYVPLLNRLHNELGTRVIFNPVSGYGLTQTLAKTDYDICYEEFWPWDGEGYKNLRDTVFRLKSEMGSCDKGIVLAAYMDKDNQTGEFNTPGILLTDAVLMASGAAHLELGDTGMLKSEYYPGGTLSIGDELNAALQRYYSFFVAYENLLRDNSFTLSERQTRIDLKRVSSDPKQNSVWCVNRENAAGEMLLNFINLNGVSDLRWADADGAQVMPGKQKGLCVKQYVPEKPAHVYLASPDLKAGVMEEIPFTSGRDFNGSYISFILPELDVWDLVYINLFAE
ncbi:MAG: glycoside hydrolase family 66 protein [Clostridia bacterium]|nr:glycoside hydrolase family 66 protein [Clostridia bacterium]